MGAPQDEEKWAITEIHQHLDFSILPAFCESFPASEMNSGLKTVLQRRLLKIFFDQTNALLSGT
jgi:hypothetical protein